MKKPPESLKPHKLYVLVRQDLELTYQAVQAGHALAEYLLRVPQQEWNNWDNGTLIYLGVSSEDELLNHCERLLLRGIEWKGFREPDINNELTAIACISDGKAFSNLKLLKSP